MLTLEDCIEKGRIDGLAAADRGWSLIYLPGLPNALGKTPRERAEMVREVNAVVRRDHTARLHQWQDEEGAAVVAAVRALVADGATAERVQAYERSRAVAIEEYRLASEKALHDLADELMAANIAHLPRAERRRLIALDRKASR